MINANALRRFGECHNVCCEIVMKATDAGLMPEGEEVIAVAGTGYEADTVLILKSAASKRFLAYGFSKSSLSQGNNENATFQ